MKSCSKSILRYTIDLKSQFKYIRMLKKTAILQYSQINDK